MTEQPFWDRLARKYAKQPIADPAAYELKLQTVSEYLRPEHTVLEVGCGTGSTALTLAPQVARYVATDGSREMISIANEKLRAEPVDSLRFIQADVSEPIDAAPFDVVCAFSVLHLVRDVPRALAVLRSQIKPGGFFISKTVCMKSVNPVMRALVKVLTLVGVAPKLTLLSADDLAEMIADTGLEVEIVTYHGDQTRSPFIVARAPAAQSGDLET